MAQFLLRICERERLFSAINNLRGIDARSSVKDGDLIFVGKKKKKRKEETRIGEWKIYLYSDLYSDSFFFFFE